METHEPQSLTDREKRDWLRLIRSDNVGPITFFRLLRRFGSAGEALAALPDLARRGGGKKAFKIYPEDKADSEIETLKNMGAHLIAWCEPFYPYLLAEIEDPPPLISVLGDTGLLERTAIAIVGARNASLNGRRFARDLATTLGSAGQIVVSGMARGIDASAHEGALETGTIGIVAGGVDHIYLPPQPVDATHALNLSAGVSNSNVFRGRSLS